MLTIRQKMKGLLEQDKWNSLELSSELSIEERVVFHHLEHVKRSLKGKRLVVDPYVCQGCGYVFRKRNRLDRPGRCPKCRGSHIMMATFSIK